MIIRKIPAAVVGFAALLTSINGSEAQAQSTNCSAALPEFAAAMKNGTAEALSSYLDKHAPCFEGPAKAKLKAVGGTSAQTDAKKSNDVANRKSEERLEVDASCQKFANARSKRWDEPLQFQIINRSNEKLSVSWIDYKGERSPPTDLLPSGNYGGGTFVTHPFKVTRADGSCVKIVMPKLGKSEYYIGK